jgi:hypothetical protein
MSVESAAASGTEDIISATAAGASIKALEEATKHKKEQKKENEKEVEA